MVSLDQGNYGFIWSGKAYKPEAQQGYTGRIRLSVSAVNRTCELSGITHVTPFRKYGKHSTGPSTYGPWVRTYSKLSCTSILTVCSYRAQSNEICAYGRVSRGSLPRVRWYGLLYLRTVDDHCKQSYSSWNIPPDRWQPGDYSGGGFRKYWEGNWGSTTNPFIEGNPLLHMGEWEWLWYQYVHCIISTTAIYIHIIIYVYMKYI